MDLAKWFVSKGYIARTNCTCMSLAITEGCQWWCMRFMYIYIYECLTIYHSTPFWPKDFAGKKKTKQPTHHLLQTIECVQMARIEKNEHQMIHQHLRFSLFRFNTMQKLSLFGRKWNDMLNLVAVTVTLRLWQWHK